jgi:NADPH:quinone reductase-like Zn-dependent oxidoreductase
LLIDSAPPASIQLVKALGGRVAVTASTPEKLNAAVTAGAEHTDFAQQFSSRGAGWYRMRQAYS